MVKKLIKTLIILATGAAIGSSIISILKNKVINKETKRVEKFKEYYNLLNQWVIVKQESKTIEKFFSDRDIQTIAIYGMGELGNRFYDEIKNSSIKVVYAIDENAGNTYSELNTVTLDDELEKVDAIIVTATFAYDDIESKLRNMVDYQIISLEDVIFEL